MSEHDHDHGQGHDHRHEYGPDHDHVHEDERMPEEEQEHPFWKIDTITLTSVGIDIGTATSQIIFSRLFLRRLGRELSSRFVVVERDTLYLSPVHFTPYTQGRERIDDRALGELVDAAYREAGLTPENVDTGAVILTGEAIRRDNARAIADLFAAERGNFVCATAGHNFEALLAAHGSGSTAVSQEEHCRVLNVDIGGGTTKLTALDHGRILGTEALHVGGRLAARDGEGRLTLLEPAGQLLARNAGLSWELGQKVGDEDFERVADYMARTVLAILRSENLSPEQEKLFLTPPLPGPRTYDYVIFSGGVGEYVYGKESASFGDLGAPMGQALRRYTSDSALPWPLHPARECIRATVMGASQYTVQVSGNTIYMSSGELLPRRNLQALRPACDLSSDIDPAAIAQSIRDHFRSFDLEEGDADVALVFHWDGPPLAIRLAALCEGLIKALPRTIERRQPIFLVFDHDLGALIGRLLKEELHLPSEVLSIDGIVLHDFDFIDLGQMLMPSETVPVTIKSLIFHM